MTVVEVVKDEQDYATEVKTQYFDCHETLQTDWFPPAALILVPGPSTPVALRPA